MPKSPNSNLDFGAALACLKGGAKATRAGWNGKDMWVQIMRLFPTATASKSPTPEELHTLVGGDTFKVRPYLMMKTVDNDLVVWVASQTDLFAEDWIIFNDVSHETKEQ